MSYKVLQKVQIMFLHSTVIIVKICLPVFVMHFEQGHIYMQKQ